ncbi:MAG: hypothetical protein KKA42_04195, partial [candidate division Zixibacteria bacterium]|nr:hypothetical protein [candidate division Zixibacteria bacterium]
LIEIVRYEPYRSVNAGAGVGLATRSGGGFDGPATGWSLTSHLSFMPKGSRWGVRLDGLATHMYEKAALVSDSATTESLGMVGGSASLLVRLRALPSVQWQARAGVGLYAGYRTRANIGPGGDYSNRELSSGFVVGLTGRTSLRLVAATFDILYLHMTHDISPDFLVISIGLSTH